MSFNIGTQLNDSKEGNSDSNKKHNGRLALNSFHMFHEGRTIKGKDFRVILDYGLLYGNTTDYGFQNCHIGNAKDTKVNKSEFNFNKVSYGFVHPLNALGDDIEVKSKVSMIVKEEFLKLG